MQRLHGSKTKPSEVVIRRTKSFLDDFQRAKRDLRKLMWIQDSGRRQTHWSPRSDGCFKMNVSTTINTQTTYIGVGAIIQNAKGEVMIPLAEKLQVHFTPKIVETKATSVFLL